MLDFKLDDGDLVLQQVGKEKVAAFEGLFSFLFRQQKLLTPTRRLPPLSAKHWRYTPPVPSSTHSSLWSRRVVFVGRPSSSHPIML